MFIICWLMLFTGGEILIGKTGIGFYQNLLQGVDQSADPNHVLVPVPVLRGNVSGIKIVSYGQHHLLM